MVRKRPCRVCRKWFHPAAQAGNRQHVCSNEDCQRERHRLNCKAWRQRNHEAEQVHRIRQKILADIPGPGRPPPGQPAAGIGLCWLRARQVVGLETAVLVEEMAKELQRTWRDSAPP